jgi:predicted ribosome quality control (RQC) complex YloA/Tae2 family protein
VRRYTSPDGLAILVGRSGEENDTLTFRVASPWDFWLHAAGRPGAHVVVRNPKRLKTLPERSLRVAAEIAAFHSGARQESKVEVHYTQRKHIHKKKGMPGGQVLLRRFRTIQVAPRLPVSTVQEV